jgi:hypothetical protein
VIFLHQTGNGPSDCLCGHTGATLSALTVNQFTGGTQIRHFVMTISVGGDFGAAIAGSHLGNQMIDPGRWDFRRRTEKIGLRVWDGRRQIYFSVTSVTLKSSHLFANVVHELRSLA